MLVQEIACLIHLMVLHVNHSATLGSMECFLLIVLLEFGQQQASVPQPAVHHFHLFPTPVLVIALRAQLLRVLVLPFVAQDLMALFLRRVWVALGIPLVLVPTLALFAQECRISQIRDLEIAVQMYPTCFLVLLSVILDGREIFQLGVMFKRGN